MASRRIYSQAPPQPMHPQHIPMAPLQYHHPQQYPQPYPQQQNHLQVQSVMYPQRADVGLPPVPPTQGISVLAPADLYRQQQGILVTPPPQRMQPWDDRSFRHVHQAPIPQAVSDPRLDSNNGSVILERYPVDAHGRYTENRLVYPRQQETGSNVVVHRNERNVYWQPTGNHDVASRSYQRSPKSSPPRDREYYVENDRFSAPSRTRVVNTPRSHEARKRSRERSRSPHPRVHRFPRIPDHRNYGRRHYAHEEGDEREDGQLTPARSPEGSRRRFQRHTSTRHLEHNQRVSSSSSQKRDRSGYREHSPAKKSRLEERGHKHSYREETFRKDVNSSAKTQTAEKEPPKALPPETTPVEHNRIEEQPPEKRSGNDALTTTTQVQELPQVQEVVNLVVNPEAQEVFNCEAQEVETPQVAELEKVVIETVAVNTVDTAETNGDRVASNVVSIEPEQRDALASIEPEPGEFIEEVAPSNVAEKDKTCPAEKTTTCPPAEEIERSKKNAEKEDQLNQAGKAQAVLTIRKNPSMPVAFKPRTAINSTSSKTWHRNGNASPGAPKVSSVVTNINGGVNGAAYIRKGNSLVRTPATSTVVGKQHNNGSPLRTMVTKKVTNGLSKPPGSEQLSSPACGTGAGLDEVQVVGGDSTKGDEQLPMVQEKQSENNNKGVYYKRKTNQLVRNEQSPEVAAVMKTKLGKALRLKKQRSSWVWTLGGSSLLPWKKRVRGRTKTKRLRAWALPKGKKGSLLSLISKKLQALRTSQPLYTRSADGFSLRRSGVRSIDGANLKWTKSLEKRSRDANEEATKAVAAVEKCCRKDDSSKKANETRERIVLVGLVRYKMDPSKRTLQRIQESPENSNNLSSSSGNFSASALLTPRRASIGGAVYVRMGNGNQLVRDPKASSRALASEKVRWSLHNVRSRVTKKQQYCQFFTRYGKCKKGDRKCPYIHDPDKVVVCTKFLRGTCTNTNCLLTHKVIPERMPDCSFFLQGLCINKECPYRHVNVNPNAPVCEGFLKGYCASGDQCNKKHTYMCPGYAATGECPDGKTCKLHHPRKKETNKEGGKQRQRYFLGSEIPSCALVIRSGSERGNCLAGEFISINGISVDEISGEDEIKQVSERKRKRGLLNFSDMSEEEVERLIKPAFVFEYRDQLPLL